MGPTRRSTLPPPPSSPLGLVAQASDLIADLDLRIKTLTEEIANVGALFHYHHSMRTRKGRAPPATAGAAAGTGEARRGSALGGSIASSSLVDGGAGEGSAAAGEGDAAGAGDPRRGLLSKLLGQGHSASTSLTGALKSLKQRGMQLDDDARAAAEAGVVISDSHRLKATAVYRAPDISVLPETFVEEYTRDMRARLEQLQRQRLGVLRQLAGRKQSLPRVAGAAASPTASSDSPGDASGDASASAGSSEGDDSAAAAPAGDAAGGGAGAGAGAGAGVGKKFRVLVESVYPPCLLSPLAITDPWHG
jgi:hypothetical protein